MNKFEKTHEELKRQLASLGIYDSDSPVQDAESDGSIGTEKILHSGIKIKEQNLEKSELE